MNTFIKEVKKPSKNQIEQILDHSVSLFLRTGMKELAHKWEIILNNYQKSLHLEH